MEWRYILNDAYEVSEYGDIRRTAWAKGARPGHILQPFMHRKGYKSIVLQLDGKRTRGFVHKFVALAFLGERPPLMEVNHKDGNKLNNHWTNLEYVTGRKNYDEAVKLHLHAHGTAHTHAKLDDAQVRELRQRYSAGERLKDLAEAFNVNKSTLQALFKGKTWKHIT